MTTNTQPLRLGSLELLNDRIRQTTMSKDTHGVETVLLDQVQRTSVRRAHVLPLLLSSAALMLAAFSDNAGSTDTIEISTRLILVGFAVALGVLYMLTRSVMVSVSAGAYTVTERLAGTDAKMAEATRFVQRVDRATLRVRGQAGGSEFPAARR